MGLFILFVSGCEPMQSTPIDVGPQPTTMQVQTQVSHPTARLTATPISTTSQVEPPVATDTVVLTPTAVITPTAEADGVTLYYHGNAMFEILSPSGPRVLIDVYDPALLSKPAGEQDILLTSHHHHDHYQADFAGTFPGQQIDRQAGEVVTEEVRITSIPSSHNAGERLRLAGGTNYIFLIEIGGLRIVHFGDIGQDHLNPDQLEVLKPVDVAISQLRNPYSDMGMQDLKGFVLMDQVQPALFIPTHASLETIQFALNRWTGYLSDGDSVFINPARLNQEPGILLFGSNAHKYGNDLPLEIW